MGAWHVSAWHVVAGAAIAAVVGSALYVLFAHDRLAADLRRALRRRVTYLVGLPAFLVVMALGVPYVYLHSTSVESVAPMTFEDLPGFSPSTTLGAGSSTVASHGAVAGAPAAASAEVPASTDTSAAAEMSDVAAPPTDAPATVATTLPPAPLDGHWVVSSGSQARYGVDDTVLGQTQRVVGATDQVSGSMQITGSVVEAVHVVVDMASVRCNCTHDEKYQDMLDTDQYPTSTFDLTSPIPLSAIPADGEVVPVHITGTLTIHGVTRTIEATLDAVQRGGLIGVNGSIPVRLEDFAIDNSNSNALANVSNPAIELLIGFAPG